MDGVAEIAEEVVEASFPSGVADFVFDAVEAAEFEFCLAVGFFWADSCGYVAGDLAIEMEAELLIEFFLRAGFLKRRRTRRIIPIPPRLAR